MNHHQQQQQQQQSNNGPVETHIPVNGFNSRELEEMLNRGMCIGGFPPLFLFYLRLREFLAPAHRRISTIAQADDIPWTSEHYGTLIYLLSLLCGTVDDIHVLLLCPLGAVRRSVDLMYEKTLVCDLSLPMTRLVHLCDNEYQG